MTDLDRMTAQERKDHPIFSGVLKYFPNALLEVSHVSKVGNDQHNPGEPLHWAMEKSTDEGDALVRHQIKAGTRDSDGERHSAKVAWRALAQLEREILAEREAYKQADDACRVAAVHSEFLSQPHGEPTLLYHEGPAPEWEGVFNDPRGPLAKDPL